MTDPFLVSHEGQRIGERALPDDDPFNDLQLLETNLKDGFARVILQNVALARSLGRDSVDVDLESILENVKDVVDDHIGLEMMRLENEQ